MVPLFREVLLKTKLGRIWGLAPVLFLLALLGAGCDKKGVLATTPAVEEGPNADPDRRSAGNYNLVLLG